MSTINGELDKGLSEKILDTTFEQFWPHLQDKLKKVSSMVVESRKPTRTLEEMMEEVLAIVRDLSNRGFSNKGMTLSRKAPQVITAPDEEGLAGLHFLSRSIPGLMSEQEGEKKDE